MNLAEWKVESSRWWLRLKTISSLHGGYEEAAEWLDVTKDALSGAAAYWW